MEEEKKSKTIPWLIIVGLIILIGIVLLFVLDPSEINNTDNQNNSTEISNEEISNPEDDLVLRIDSLLQVIALSPNQFSSTPITLDGQKIYVTTETQSSAIEFIANLSGVALEPGVEVTDSERNTIQQAALSEFRANLPSASE